MSEFISPYFALLRDERGCPVPHGKLWFYDTNSTVAKEVFADEFLKVPLAQPVQADRFGRLPRIFLKGKYKVVARSDCNDMICGYPFDPVQDDCPVKEYTLSQVANEVMPMCSIFWVTNTAPPELRVGNGSTTGGIRIYPVSVPDASKTVKGIIEIASDVEATAGTSTTHAITPAQLAAALSRTTCASPASADQVAALSEVRLEICIPSSEDDCDCDETPTDARVSVLFSDLMTAAGCLCVPIPPETGTFTLRAVDGAASWVAGTGDTGAGTSCELGPAIGATENRSGGQGTANPGAVVASDGTVQILKSNGTSGSGQQALPTPPLPAGTWEQTAPFCNGGGGGTEGDCSSAWRKTACATT